jgi:hypothetical protein
MDQPFTQIRLRPLLQRFVRRLWCRFPQLLLSWVALSLVATFAGHGECRAVPLAYMGTRFDGLSVLDTTSDDVIAHLPGVPGVTLPMTVDEVGVAVSPEGDRVFITNPLQGMGTVFALDTGSHTVVNTIHIPDPSHDATTLAGVAISPNGKLLYVVDRGCIHKNVASCGVSPPEGKLRVIQADTGVVLASPKVFANFDPKEIVSDPRGRWVYAAPTHTPSGVSPFIVAYDRYAGRPQDVEIGGASGVDEVSLAVHPTGQWLYVSQRNEARVTVLDVSAIDRGFINPVVAQISVGTAPHGIVVHPAGTVLYVVDAGAGRVWVIDTAHNEVIGSTAMAVNGFPHTAAVDPVHDRLYVLSGGSFSVNATGFLARRSSELPVASPATFGTFIVPEGYCGNRVVEGTEQCDDGGVCVDGADAGQPCRLSFDCEGDGQCVAVGGDGCAANCTVETEVDLPLISGSVRDGDLADGTSGLVVVGTGAAPYAVPFGGTLRLRVGGERQHEVPVVIRARPDVPAVPLDDGCACIGAAVRKTCGGLQIERDQRTPVVDCTVDASVCAGKAPCVPVYGAGNLGAGTARCDALSGVDVSLAADLRDPPSVTTHLSGTGGSGSARVPAALTLTVHSGSCSGVGLDYGPDGIRCTEDDGVDPAAEVLVLPMTLTTSTAAGLVSPASGEGQVGPVDAAGIAFNCGALRAGDPRGVGLVGASFASGASAIGEVAVMANLFAAPLPSPTVTPTVTVAVTPSRTPRSTNTATRSPTARPTGTPTRSATRILTATPTSTITPVRTPPFGAIDATGHWLLTLATMPCEAEVVQDLQALAITGTCPQFTFTLEGWIDVVTGHFQVTGSATGCSSLTADGTFGSSGGIVAGAIVCPSLAGAMTGTRVAPATPTVTISPTDHPSPPNPSSTPTAIQTASPTAIASSTPTQTASPTAESTFTATTTPSVTSSATPTLTPVHTPTPRAEPTSTSTVAPSATGTATASLPLPTATPPWCPGDCDGDGQVTVGELIEGVRMSLGGFGVEDCKALDRNGDVMVTVEELIAAVQAALTGCAT